MKRPVKEWILPVLLSLYVLALRVLRIIGIRTIDNSVLLLPPTSPGSLGDEAILAASLQELAAEGIEKVGLVSYSSEDSWDHLQPVKEIINLHDYFHYGSWKVRFRFARLVSRQKHLYFFGTDQMDGFYYEEFALKQIALVALAARTGTPSTIVGFSFNKHPTPAMVKALGNLPPVVRLCGRDPISHGRLTQHLSRPIELVADPAFLLQPDKNSEIVLGTSRWIRAQKEMKRTIIGVNLNYLFLNQVTRLEPDELVQVYVSALTELFSRCQALSFLLIPHDTRGQVSDVALAQALYQVAPAEMKPYLMQVPSPCRAAEIKAICADLDIALSGRMHVAIACLGQGTPVACITYQDKFEGLFRHFELNGMTTEPEQAIQPGNLVRFFMPLVERRDDIRRHIRSRLPQVTELARANFVRLGYNDDKSRSQ